MDHAPFFEPWQGLEEDQPPEPDVDVPWMPPTHVAGVVVPLGVDVSREQDVVVKVSHAVAYRRGLELHVGVWIRPGALRPLSDAAHVWREQEPRVGFRLADGTRLGHRNPHGSESPQLQRPDLQAAPISLAQTGGHGGGLRFASSWWLFPFPQGDGLDVVVQWEHQGVPESTAWVDLDALRQAAAGEDVLWAPPSSPGDGAAAWSGYAPTGGGLREPGDRES